MRMPGTRGEFDRSLEAIEAKVVELFVMIVEDLPRAAQALEGVGGETARVLAERERVIDSLYLEVESLASREVLLQAPVAADLRFLLSVLRVTPELERSHDLVMQVADRAGLAAPAGALRPAPSPRRWATLPAGCGARQPTPGTSATTPP
jgi:phosphate transport system protein